MDTSRELLEERIVTEFENLDELSEEEKSKAIKNIEALYKLKIEEERLDAEYDDKYQRRVMEDEHHSTESSFRQQQIDMEKEDRALERDLKNGQFKKELITLGVTVGVPFVASLASSLFYDRWLTKGLKFEETGTIVTPHVRNLFSKILPKK